MGVLKEKERDSVSDLERSEVRDLEKDLMERSKEDLEEELLRDRELRIDKNVVLRKLEEGSGLFTMYCKKCNSYSCEHVKSAIISNDELEVIQEYLINSHLTDLAGDLLRCLEKHSHKAQAFIINVRSIILNVKNKNIVLALDSTHDKVFYKYCKKCKSDNCEHVQSSILTQKDLLGMQMTLLDSYYEFFSEALEKCKGMKEE
jgi:hypothetical protein